MQYCAAMCHAYCCVGAPHVPSCSGPRVDSSGWPACELCGRRLSTCKGKLHKRDPGRNCHCCYTKASRSLFAAPPAPSPPEVMAKRSHKRARSDPGERVAAAAPALPPPLPLHQQATWLTHQWSLQSSCRSSRSLAASWLTLSCSDELREWEVKRGLFWQHSADAALPCSFLDEQRVRLRHGSDRLGRQLLSTLGVDATRLQLAAVKLLRTRQGQGQQEIHFDIPDYDRACQCFSLLLYLTSTESTAVPTLPLSDLRAVFSSEV